MNLWRLCASTPFLVYALATPAVGAPSYQPTATGGIWTFSGDSLVAASDDAVKADQAGVAVDTGTSWYPDCFVNTTPIKILMRPGYKAQIAVDLSVQNFAWEGAVRDIDAINRMVFETDIEDGSALFLPKSTYLYQLDPHPAQEATMPDGRLYMSARAASAEIPFAPFELTAAAPQFKISLCQLPINIRLKLSKVSVTVDYQQLNQ